MNGVGNCNVFYLTNWFIVARDVSAKKKGERKERNMGASSSGQVITPKKGKSLFEIQSRSVFQVEISYEFTEIKIYMQFQEQYDGTGGDERFST